MTLIRRFFSGPSLMQAVLAAARHHEVDPEDLVYEVIDKKHGFLKTPRGVVIEVDPEQPTAARPPAPTAPAAPPIESAPAAPRDRLEEMTEPVAPEAVDSAPVSDPPPPAAPVDEAPQPEAPPSSEPSSDDPPPAPADPEPAMRRPPASELVDAEWSTPKPAPPASPEPAPPADAAADAAAPDANWWDAAPAALEPPAAAEPAVEPPSGETATPPMPHEAPVALESAAVEALADPAASSSSAPAVELGDDLRQAVAQAVDELVYLAGLRVQVASATEVDDGLAVELEGPDSRRVVAHGGRALLAIQHLLPRLLFNKLGRATHCRLDCEGFHAARGARLERMAREAAERVRAGGRSWLLEPMAPDERRLVHLALADEPDVETESVGEGYLKRVRVAQV